MSKKTKSAPDPPLRWPLILPLAGFGALMGIASVFGLTRGIELYLWIAIAGGASSLIALRARRRLFLHGFWTGMIGGGASPLIQVIMWAAYIDHNPEAASEFAQLPASFDPKLFVLAATPLIAAFSGVMTGAMSWTAGKLLARRQTAG